MPIEVTSLTGDEIKPVLPALAKLRIIVFRDWPYLYDGTIAYEETYLAKFAAANGAVCVIARDGDEIVGASTAAPMIEHADEFAEPFEKAGYDLSKI
ncbi:MAG: GNAT family N-acetyltransferase, partial [Hyphomicrobium sp.]